MSPRKESKSNIDEKQLHHSLIEMWHHIDVNLTFCSPWEVKILAESTSKYVLYTRGVFFIPFFPGSQADYPRYQFLLRKAAEIWLENQPTDFAYKFVAHKSTVYYDEAASLAYQKDLLGFILRESG